MKTHKNGNKSKLRHITNKSTNIDVVKLTKKKKSEKKKERRQLKITVNIMKAGR
jgi:hypothetical protein